VTALNLYKQKVLYCQHSLFSSKALLSLSRESRHDGSLKDGAREKFDGQMELANDLYRRSERDRGDDDKRDGGWGHERGHGRDNLRD